MSEPTSAKPHAAKSPRSKLFLCVNIVGFLAVLGWALWWADALDRLELAGCAKTWIRYPFFGADFTTQSDYAARLWAGGVDPYSFRDHLFHYPPIVIRLFLWTPLMSSYEALRVWIVVLAALLVGGTLVALLVRRKLAVEQIPTGLALAVILLSFPGVFTLERANFDLITLLVMLIAYWLFARNDSRAEFLAGCVLAVGPWVKLYPGIMGLGLVALRRWRATAGFAVAGVAIGLAAPEETIRSFEVLRIQIDRIKNVSKTDPLPPWSHSLSVAWQELGQAAAGTPLGGVLTAISGDAFGILIVFGLASWVCFELYRRKTDPVLLYPLLLWLNALGSCVGAIANDYSLMFLPLAAVSVVSMRKDPWFVRISMALLLIWWQPVDLRVPAVPLLVIKLLGLGAVAVSLIRRGRELAPARVSEPVSNEALRATASPAA